MGVVPVKSAGGNQKVKLGRRLTAIAGCRAMLRIAAQSNRPLIASTQLIWENDKQLHVLQGSRSIGDALGGDPAAKSPGVGMKRQPFGREFLCSRCNVSLAVRRLLDSGETAESIARLTGKASVAEFEQWFINLPSNEDVEALLAQQQATKCPVRVSKREAKKLAESARQAQEMAERERLRRLASVDAVLGPDPEGEGFPEMSKEQYAAFLDMLGP